MRHIFAETKGSMPNKVNAIWKKNTCYSFIVRKSFKTNRCYSVWNNYISTGTNVLGQHTVFNDKIVCVNGIRKRQRENSR